MKNKQIFYFLIGMGMLFFLNSCGVNSYVMFKANKDEVITENIPMSPSDAYRIAPDDKFTFKLYTEDGKKVIDVGAMIQIDGTSSGGNQLSRGSNMEYLVRQDGLVELPILGLVEVEGLSVIEMQDKFRDLYSEEYNNPFVQVEITNRRVIVFPGSGGAAKVVPLMNNNTTLMEALAETGGITERGKAKNVKVIRNSKEGRKIYEIDLSKAEGLKYSDMVVQSNDYIYVEPTKQLTREFLKEVSPIVSLLSSTIFVITTIRMFNAKPSE